MHRTWWPDLPPELLREVSTRLHVAADFVRFHAVCKPWRDSQGPSTTTGAGQLLPWLLAPSDKGDGCLNFRCVFSKTSYVAPPLKSGGTGKNTVAFADGTAVRYFTASGPHGRPTLDDPLAGGSPTHLLPVLSPHGLGKNPSGIIYNDGAVLLFSKHDIIDTFTAEFRAALLRPGDAEWMFVHRTLELPSDGEFCVAYHNGKIHVTVEDGLICWHVVSVAEQSTAATNSDDVLVPRPSTMPHQQDGYLYEHSYVLESRGELLWASVHISMNYPVQGENGVNDLVGALSMSVHTLEEVVAKGPEKLMWTTKDGRSLEDRVLFLGWPNSFAMDAAGLGLSGGFAYFSYYDDQGGRLPQERCGVFRYNLIDNATEFVEWLPRGWDYNMFMWLLPQLTIAPVHQVPRSNNTCVGVLTPSLPLTLSVPRPLCCNTCSACSVGCLVAR
ncbi:hypothetical protein ZWY2020_026112 [Hordeum vulgare]|nr:hypothetical protein ZWY2020_026112 [Hordeum vulgare]